MKCYHCCIFEYGQTGSDKSYSIVDYGNNKGIVLISCEDIFNGINENKEPNLHLKLKLLCLKYIIKKLKIY